MSKSVSYTGNIIGILIICFFTISNGSAMDTQDVTSQIQIGNAQIISKDITTECKLNYKSTERNPEFFVSVGGNGCEISYFVQETSDGGYIVTGNTSSYGAGDNDVLLLKFDSLGSLTWARTAGGPDYDTGYSVQQTSDGGYIVVGLTGVYTGFLVPYPLLLKYDSIGNLIWAKSLDWTMFYNSVQQTSDGGYIVIGDENSGWNLVLKYNSLGEIEWAKWGRGNGADIKQTSDGGYIIVGAFNSDIILSKYDSQGDVTWSRTAGGTGDEYGFSVQQTTDGGYIIAGYTSSYGAGWGDLLLLKYDSSGNLIWSKTAGGTGQDFGASVWQTTDNGYVVAEIYDNMDCLLMKYDIVGNLTWSRIVNGLEAVHVPSVQQTSDGGYVLTGLTNDGHIALLKTDTNGWIADCPEIEEYSPVVTSPSVTSNTYSYTTTVFYPTPSSPILSITSPSLTETTICNAPIQTPTLSSFGIILLLLTISVVLCDVS